MLLVMLIGFTVDTQLARQCISLSAGEVRPVGGRGGAYIQSERYKGYDVWGHAMGEELDVTERERFVASGTVTRAGNLVEASGVTGSFVLEEQALSSGMDWARAWV